MLLKIPKIVKVYRIQTSGTILKLPFSCLIDYFNAAFTQYSVKKNPLKEYPFPL